MKHKSVIRILSTEVARLAKTLEEIQQRMTKLETLKFERKRQKRLGKKSKKMPEKAKVGKEDALLMKITAAAQRIVKLEKGANLVKRDLIQIEEFAKALKEAEARQKRVKAMDRLPEAKSHLDKSVLGPCGVFVEEVRKRYISFQSVDEFLTESMESARLMSELLGQRVELLEAVEKNRREWSEGGTLLKELEKRINRLEATAKVFKAEAASESPTEAKTLPEALNPVPREDDAEPNDSSQKSAAKKNKKKKVKGKAKGGTSEPLKAAPEPTETVKEEPKDDLHIAEMPGAWTIVGISRRKTPSTKKTKKPGPKYAPLLEAINCFGQRELYFFDMYADMKMRIYSWQFSFENVVKCRPDYVLSFVKSCPFKLFAKDFENGKRMTWLFNSLNPSFCDNSEVVRELLGKLDRSENLGMSYKTDVFLFLVRRGLEIGPIGGDTIFKLISTWIKCDVLTLPGHKKIDALALVVWDLVNCIKAACAFSLGLKTLAVVNSRHASLLDRIWDKRYALVMWFLQGLHGTGLMSLMNVIFMRTALMRIQGEMTEPIWEMNTIFRTLKDIEKDVVV
ncbi:hypothetical protein L596_009638 [Steinernema carpocapsae]|uniref:Uncharacterized protein n=1 Tax=Steinernema carpocapsae TaxID=34508 RepID=A0A4U5PFY4_STECR|nr:hypothetical protein L596_009638 [Steinernema carpocapsae]